ncbi:MAG: hypothetical protein ABMA64_11600 [Myxococcota bacterium]
MRWWTWAAAAAIGCEPVNPCDEYVDYMCDCHVDDTGTNCQALTATYASADQDVQAECAVLLDDQQQADQSAGVCETTTGSSTSR